MRAARPPLGAIVAVGYPTASRARRRIHLAKCLAAFSLLCPPISTAAARESHALTLKQAVDYALLHSPTTAAASAEVGIRELEAKNAQAKRFPSLDFDSSHGFEKRIPDLNPPPGAPLSSRFSLTLSQPLFDNGATAKQGDIADLNEQRARLAAQKARDDVVLAVAQAFYRVSKTDILLGIRRQQQDLLDKQYRSSVEQHRQGLKTTKDVLRIQTETQRVAIEVKQAETDRHVAELALREAMGVPRQSAEPMSFTWLSAQDAQTMEPDFPKVHPNVGQSYLHRLNQLEDKAAQTQVELARLKSYPEFTASSGVSYGATSYLGSGDPPYERDAGSWSIMLGLKYNLWDGGTRSRDVAIAAEQRQKRALEMQKEVLAYETKISALLSHFATLRSTYELNKRLVELEEANVSALEQDYRQGKVVYLDLITGINNLLAARVGFYGMYIDILDSLAQFRYHEGTIYEFLASR